jgi:hypothetical protein
VKSCQDFFASTVWRTPHTQKLRSILKQLLTQRFCVLRLKTLCKKAVEALYKASRDFAAGAQVEKLYQ